MIREDALQLDFHKTPPDALKIRTIWGGRTPLALS
jgi:hypothetical protein